jgi:hypothetical protein
MSQEKYYITLLNDQRVRVEFTLNVMQEILGEIGEARFRKIVCGKSDIEAFKIACLAMVKAGEAIEGRTVTLTPEDLGRLMPLHQASIISQAIGNSSALKHTKGRILSN